MANYKMVFSYDGSRYKGWQKLGTEELTIQGMIERSIGQVLDYPVEIHGSGRTDAGVHATGQVANMQLPFLLRQEFSAELNRRLPEDIRLLSVERVKADFHARYSAKGKRYRYQVDTNEKANVFRRKYLCHYPQKLNHEQMKKAAEYFIGENDFTSFTDDKSEKDKVRRIDHIQIIEQNGIYEFVYCGDGFLQHMIRIMTGTLLEIGSGKRQPEEILEILEGKERAKAGFMVPGKGLFLEEVKYD